MNARDDLHVSGEWCEWGWDETLFAGAARYYDRGRLPNAPGLAKAFQTALGFDGRRTTARRRLWTRHGDASAQPPLSTRWLGSTLTRE